MAGTKIRGVTIELNADTAGILDGLKDLNSSLSKTDKSLKDVNKLLKFDDNNTELLAQQQLYLSEAIEKTEEKLKKEKELLEQMKNADNADETREQQNALAREIEATSQKLNEYKSQLNQTDHALEEVNEETKEASHNALTFGDIVKANLVSEVIIQGIRKIAEGIKEIATSAMSVGMEFESSMSQVAATMGMTTQEIQQGSEAYRMLSEAARECGATTMFTASQAADALNYLALAGYDAEKAAETLPKVLTLAAAGGMELAYASDLITDSMSALGMSTAELDNYMDEMAKTAQKSNTSVAQLGEAILVCGGTVKLTGQSLETMNTELGILANNGIKGAEGGTHLRNILLSLSAPTDKAADSIKALGLQISDSQGNMRDLNDIMLDLNAALEGMGTAEKASVIKSIFNKTDIAAVNALMKGSVEEFGNLKAKIEDCEGAAKAMSETMMDNLEGKITILKSALEGLGVTFYDIFDEDAKTAVESATTAVDQLQDAMKNGELGQSLNELSAAFGNLMEDVIQFTMDALPGVIDGATWFIDNIGSITDLLESLGLGFVAYKVAVLAATIATEGFTVALNMNPIGLAVAGVVGLTAALVKLSAQAEELDPQMESYVRKCEAVVQKTNNLSSSSDELISKFQSEGTYIEELKGRLEELQGKTSLTAAEQKEQANIVSDLNTLIPDLNLSIDEQGRVVSETADNWRDYIDVMLQQAEAAAIQEKLIELAEQRLEAEISLQEIEDQLTEDAKREIEVDKERNDLLSRFNELTDEELQRLDELTYMTDPLTQEQRALATEYENTSSAIETLTGKQETLTDRLAEVTQGTDTLTDSTSAAVDANNELAESCEEVTEELEKERESLEKLVEGQIASFEKLSEATAVSKEDVIANLESNIEAMEDWADNMQTLAERGIDDGLLKYLADMGPEGAAQVEEFVNMTGEELEKAGGLWREALSAQNFTDDLVDEYMTAGTNATQAYIDGAWVPIEDGTMSQLPEAMVGKIVEDENWERLPEEIKTNIIESMMSTSEELAEDEESAGGIPEALVGKIVEDENWERLPEEVKEKIIESLLIAQEGIVEEDETGTVIADSIDDGFIQETEARAPEVAQSIQTGIVDPVINTMNEKFQTGEGLPAQVFVNYGMNFVDSLKQGIETNTPVVLLPALAKMAEDSLLQVQTTLGWDGGKFQRFYEVGLKVDESIATGIQDGSDIIGAALQSAFDEAIGSLDFSSLSSAINQALGAALG